MKSNFATRAKAIETMYGVDSGTTRKLLKELYAEQQKFADGGPIGGPNSAYTVDNSGFVNKAPDIRKVNRTGVDSQTVSKIDSLSNVLRGYQTDMTNQLMKTYPNIPIKDELMSASSDPNWKNSKLDDWAGSLIGKYGTNPTIPTSPEYVKTAEEYNKMASQYGTSIPQLGTTEGDKLGQFGFRTAGIKYMTPSGENAYGVLNQGRKPTVEAGFANGGSIFDHPLIQELGRKRLSEKYGNNEFPQIVSPQNGQQVTESTPPPSVAQTAYAPTQQRIDNATPQAHTTVPNVPYLDLIKKYFKEDQWSNAARVMMGESAGNAKAFRGEKRNPGGGNDSGLFQFNSKYHPEVYSGGDIFNPEYNIMKAAELHSKQGWKPWVAAKKYNISADGGNLYPVGGGMSIKADTRQNWLNDYIQSKFPNISAGAIGLETISGMNPISGIQGAADFTGIPGMVNALFGNPMNLDPYQVQMATMPVLGATGKAAGIVEDAMSKGYAAKAAYAAKKAGQATQNVAGNVAPQVAPTVAGESQFVQESMAKLQAEAAANAKPQGKISSMVSGLIHPTTTRQGLTTAGILGATGYGAYKLFGDNSKNPGVQSSNPGGVMGGINMNQIPNMNYSTEDNPNYYDSKAGPQNTGDVGAYAKTPTRPGNLSPLQSRQPVLPFGAPPNELAPTPDFTQLHPDTPGGGIDINNLMRMAPVFANMIPGRRPQGIPNDLTLPRVNAQKFAPEYLSTAPITEQLGSQYRTGVGELAGLTGGSASAMRAGLQGLNRSAGRSAGEALTDIYGRNTGLKNSTTQYNLENVNKANMFNAEMGAKEALSRKDMDATNKELSLHFTNQEQQRRAAAFTQLGQIGKENVQNKLAERIYGYSSDGTKITDPKKKAQVVYKQNPKIVKKP